MKTIYVLLNGVSFGSLGSPLLAFECQECAEVQKAWLKRDGVHAVVVTIYCYSDMRDAQKHDCEHVKHARPGKNSAHEHIPLTVDAMKG